MGPMLDGVSGRKVHSGNNVDLRHDDILDDLESGR